MNQLNKGGTAFPMQDQQAIHSYAAAAIVDITDSGERDRVYLLARAQAIGGMSLRDYFAAKAMQGAMADPTANFCSQQDAAEWAYTMADAMLLARISDQTKGQA